MKRIYTILVAVLITASVFAQTPEKMSYQAVVRDASSQLVTSTSVGMQISILQTSATGTAVYVERQFPTTNVNGLVTIEIGAGTVVSGDFATIDWANDVYFIKTETDPAGGANYTITGTSQLMSVPYALHAKTAESITGGITETDPIYTASQAANISSTDITNLSNLSGTNTGDQDGSETKVTAGANISVTGTGTTASPYVVNATGTTPLAIGDSYGGGIIFWLDASGQHGLIAATIDQSASMRWYAGSNTNTMALANGIGAGKSNTDIIIANQGNGDGATYAARVCHEYQGGNYGDWYLPSEYELNLLYSQKTAVGGFASDDYWSSTEVNNGNAVFVYFGNGFLNAETKDAAYRVRAIRAF